jgi:Cytochrome P460
MTTIRIPTVLCLATTLATAAAEPAPADRPAPAVTKENVKTFHRKFERLTKEPYQVTPPGIIHTDLCAPPPMSAAEEKRQTGPHFKALIHIYANEPANKTFAQKLKPIETATQGFKPFPAGAIVAKEKLTANGSVWGIGGMIKRAPGFDPKNGDWEYYYFDAKAGFSSGRLDYCSDCHSGARKNDYVFSVWKKFE